MDRTLKFEIVTGINKGYFHNNSKDNALDLVGGIWQRIAKEEYERSGIYVSAVIKPSKIIYNEAWGCPKGGEEAVVITGVGNMEFVKDIKDWKDSVIILVEKLKGELSQVTLTCEFMETRLYYFK